MKAIKNILFKSSSFLIGIIFLVSCQPERSKTTGWHYNNPNDKGSGYEKFPAMDQETGPGLTLIEGGFFIMGSTEELEFMPTNDEKKRVTVPSFYLDQTEVSNFDYLEYLFWLRRVYGSVDVLNPNRYEPDKKSEDEEAEEGNEEDEEFDPSKKAFYKFQENYSESFTSNYQEVYRKALPDTLCWRSPLASMEHFVNYYLRHPAYRDYPVVGVSWIQANEYCKWRTDRVNEYILAREGILDWEMSNKELSPFQMFSTEAYLSGQYFGLDPAPRETNRNYQNEEEYQAAIEEAEAAELEEAEAAAAESGVDERFTKKSASDNGRRLRNYNPSMRSYSKSGKESFGARIVRMEDGILLPNYRLPTEAEWEYAATGLIGTMQDNSENYTDRRNYPWTGHWVRREEEQFQGSMQINFMRGSGDYMGVAGNLNDGAAPTAPVESYWPNDFGLFHMAGNVSEWVQDVYRLNTLEDADGFSPFRGNVYTTKLTTTVGLHDAMKNDRVRYDVHGMKQYVLDYERVRYQRIAGSNVESREWDPSKPQGNGRDEKDFEIYYDHDVYNFSKFNAIDAGDSIFVTDSAAGYWKTSPPTVTFELNGTAPSGVNLKDEFDINKSSGQIISKKGILNKPGKYLLVVKAKNAKLKEEKIDTIYINIMDKKILPIDGINKKSKSSNPAQARRGTAPDPLFVSSGSLFADKANAQNPNTVFNVKNTQYKRELQFIDSIHYWLDTAIYLTNNLRTTEASRQINKGLWGRVFNDDYIKKLFPEYLDDPALTTMISVLRNGLTEYVLETEGQMRYRRVTEEENLGRLNYRKDDYIDYLDGDVESSIFFNNEERMKAINMGKRDPKMVMYQSEHERYDLSGGNIGNAEWDKGQPTSLVSDRTRVYKGGSWEDQAYWLNAGRRRFLDERQSTRNIGFRCAMDRVGSPTGKNYGKKKKRKS